MPTFNGLGNNARRLFDDLIHARSLQLLMLFNETSGTVYDRTAANRLTGTVEGNPTYSKSIQGGVFKGMDFDGTGDFIQMSSATPFNWEYTQAFTILTIIVPLVDASVHTLYSKYAGGATNTGIVWQIDSSGLLALAILNDTNILYKATDSALTSGAEIMAGVTYTGSGTAAGALLYVNGVQPAQTAAADTLGGNSIVNLGNAVFGTAANLNYYNGDMGLMAILTRAATPSEMKRWAYLAGYYP